MPKNDVALCDAGPLVALLDSSDGAHEVCESALRAWPGRFLTTWPVLAEAFHFLDSPGQREALWEFIERTVPPMDLSGEDSRRMRVLMRQYLNLPLDLADASLVVVAERLNLRKIFTLDRHFRIVRPRHTRSFEVFP